MHDLATNDLAVRLGGSKTGLLNASLVSNECFSYLSCAETFLLSNRAIRECSLLALDKYLIDWTLRKCGNCSCGEFDERDRNITLQPHVRTTDHRFEKM